VNLHWQISAGEAFEVLRPAALVASALLSAWVLASARRWRFQPLVISCLALGSFLVPFVVVPLYLIARGWAKRRIRTADADSAEPSSISIDSRAVRGRFLWPLAYTLVLLSAIGVYLYRDYHSVDGHLARAEQAKVVGHPDRAISEFRAALALEDNPHTHKLLGIQLTEAGQVDEALSEFQLAEKGGEPDDSLPFRIAKLLTAKGDQEGSLREYQKFLDSPACKQKLPDDRCEIARKGVIQSSR
jgi:tetratricopeptide (TPR) repeat protein